jgi:hypothetical protein
MFASRLPESYLALNFTQNRLQIPSYLFRICYFGDTKIWLPSRTKKNMEKVAAVPF